MNKTTSNMNITSRVWSHAMRTLLIATSLIIGSWGNTALAASYHYTDCSCNPLTSGEKEGNYGKCSCTSSYSLGKLATKEFRFLCKGTNAVRDVAHTDQSISGLKSSTTCTIPVGGTTYISRSCTNWSAGVGDGLTLTTICHSHEIK